eukprot:jgi/Tetstr1/462540/TSEL_007529.t1
MIDFACVSSTTPTWGNDPRWCTPGMTATEAEHNKLAADRASSAPVQGVHRYYPFVVEDRGRLGKSALTVVYIFAMLLAKEFGDREAFVVFRAFETLGKKWSLIAGALPGRTDNAHTSASTATSALGHGTVEATPQIATAAGSSKLTRGSDDSSYDSYFACCESSAGLHKALATVREDD